MSRRERGKVIYYGQRELNLQRRFIRLQRMCI